MNYDVSVLIGRCQPATNAHISHIYRGLERSDRVIVLLGSAQEERTIKNPLNYFERASIIRENFEEPERARIMFRPLRDFKDDVAWTSEVKHQVAFATETMGVYYGDLSIALLGTHKDSSSWYLKEFPFWKHIGHDTPLHHNGNIINATDVRNILFSEKDELDSLSDILSNQTIHMLRVFRQKDGWHIVMNKRRLLS